MIEDLAKTKLEAGKQCAAQLLSQVLLIQPPENSISTIMFTVCNIFNELKTLNDFNSLCILITNAIQ